MTELMVGRKIIMSYDQFKEPTDKKVMAFKAENINLNKKGIEVLKHVSFGVRAGEILGIAGVQGNGQNELIEGLVGLAHFNTGKWFVEDKELTNLSIEKKRASGLAYIPEDRMKDGIAQGASVAENLISSYYKRADINGPVFMDNKGINTLANRLIEMFSVKTKSSKSKIESLSGGNIQKVVVARETNTSPKILIAEQPTRGIDIGSEEFIHHELIKMRNKDVAILLVSADLNEVMEVSDRLIVMYEGEIVAHFDTVKGLTDKELGLYMLGAKRQDEESIRRALTC
jgi:simple sugar transport system ATP-binding protein